MNLDETIPYTGELKPDTIKVLRDEANRLAKIILEWETKREATLKELDGKIALHSNVKNDLELLLMGRE